MLSYIGGKIIEGMENKEEETKPNVGYGVAMTQFLKKTIYSLVYLAVGCNMVFLASRVKTGSASYGYYTPGDYDWPHKSYEHWPFTKKKDGLYKPSKDIKVLTREEKIKKWKSLDGDNSCEAMVGSAEKMIEKALSDPRSYKEKRKAAAKEQKLKRLNLRDQIKGDAGIARGKQTGKREKARKKMEKSITKNNIKVLLGEYDSPNTTTEKKEEIFKKLEKIKNEDKNEDSRDEALNALAIIGAQNLEEERDEAAKLINEAQRGGGKQNWLLNAFEQMQNQLAPKSRKRRKKTRCKSYKKQRGGFEGPMTKYKKRKEFKAAKEEAKAEREDKLLSDAAEAKGYTPEQLAAMPQEQKDALTAVAAGDSQPIIKDHKKAIKAIQKEAKVREKIRKKKEKRLKKNAAGGVIGFESNVLKGYELDELIYNPCYYGNEDGKAFVNYGDFGRENELAGGIPKMKELSDRFTGHDSAMNWYSWTQDKKTFEGESSEGGTNKSQNKGDESKKKDDEKKEENDAGKEEDGKKRRDAIVGKQLEAVTEGDQRTEETLDANKKTRRATIGGGGKDEDAAEAQKLIDASDGIGPEKEKKRNAVAGGEAEKMGKAARGDKEGTLVVGQGASKEVPAKEMKIKSIGKITKWNFLGPFIPSRRDEKMQNGNPQSYGAVIADYASWFAARSFGFHNYLVYMLFSIAGLVLDMGRQQGAGRYFLTLLLIILLPGLMFGFLMNWPTTIANVFISLFRYTFYGETVTNTHNSGGNFFIIHMLLVFIPIVLSALFGYIWSSKAMGYMIFGPLTSSTARSWVKYCLFNKDKYRGIVILLILGYWCEAWFKYSPVFDKNAHLFNGKYHPPGTGQWVPIMATGPLAAYLLFLFVRFFKGEGIWNFTGVFSYSQLTRKRRSEDLASVEQDDADSVADTDRAKEMIETKERDESRERQQGAVNVAQESIKQQRGQHLAEAAAKVLYPESGENMVSSSPASKGEQPQVVDAQPIVDATPMDTQNPVHDEQLPMTAEVDIVSPSKT